MTENGGSPGPRPPEPPDMVYLGIGESSPAASEPADKGVTSYLPAGPGLTFGPRASFSRDTPPWAPWAVV